jgi:ElaA protein
MNGTQLILPLKIMKWELKKFSELALIEAYNMFALRIDVFVIEQNCPYQDLDGKDEEAYHVLGKDDQGNVMATARILPPGVGYKEVAIGRVVTAKSIRPLKKGHELMDECMKFIAVKYPNENIKLSAQSHLVNYYGRHGFVETGKNYLEDGIPHSEMIYLVKNMAK